MLISEIITIFVQDRLTRRFHIRSRKFVLTTASEVGIFAMNMDAYATYWPNFRHYSTSLTSTACSTSQAQQRPTATCQLRNTTHMCVYACR